MRHSLVGSQLHSYHRQMHMNHQDVPGYIAREKLHIVFRKKSLCILSRYLCVV